VGDSISFRSARLRHINELQAENARLHRLATDLTTYLLALREALSNGTPRPRRPACIDGGDPWRQHGF
jgi:hypothetical protein